MADRFKDAHWHYFQHDPSGEVYAISVGDNGMFGDICGPLGQDERTVENLVAENFHEDEDDQAWMGSQTWRMVTPDNPDCDCRDDTEPGGLRGPSMRLSEPPGL